MKLTRRQILAQAALAQVAQAAAEQQTDAQQASSQAAAIPLNWLSNEAPAQPAGVSWGVPFPRGTVSSSQTFTLTANGVPLPLQTWPLAYWPDGSIKFNGFATVAPATAANLRLAPGAPAPVGPALTVRQTAAALEIDTGALQCSIPQSGPDFLTSLRVGAQTVAGPARLRCVTENRLTPNTLRLDDYHSEIKSVVAEQTGPVRAVVRIEGVHRAEQGTREWLPFTLRLYFYAGSENIRLVHSFIFDGDDRKDFIRGLGLSFAVPFREQLHNRHVHFAGDANGVWAEPVLPATGRRVLSAPGSRANLFEDQLAGKRLPNRETFAAPGQKLLADWATWDSYKLTQLTADGFAIQKRAVSEGCWLDAAWGHRSGGCAFVGDVSGGLAVALKNMWQSHPASFEIHAATTPAADLRVWLWSPDAAAMDLRHYDTRAHDLDSSYEDVQPGFSTPHGVARTSELMLFPSAVLPTHQDTARRAAFTQRPPLLTASPAHLHAAKVFGIWSLPDRSVPAKATLEDHLDAAFDLYHREIEQRHWYGFWNYGDVMHQHDGPRHTWRYDVGGFAWDNTELGTDLWLWYTFLRTGRADVFRMAEAMTRHTSEVDVYHLGRFAGLGSRHNVRHWGCGAKESRISQASYRRFYYNLTTDERTGDLMRAVVDVDAKLLELDPMRLASPQTEPIPYPARVRGGPDWLAFVGNWMTEWERTGQPKYRDKILAGMDSIAAMPYGFLTGPNQLYGYDPATGKMGSIVPGGYGVYNLATIMGGAEVVFELNELIDHAGWRKAWLEYCERHGARKESPVADAADARYATFARLAAYVYRETKNAAFAKKAWSRVTVPAYATTHLATPEVLNPIDEIPGLSTNSTAQGCLEAIQVLEMCPEVIPR